MTLIHATGIMFEGRGILLRGQSGTGKSDLAFRMMAQGAELVGDDYVELMRDKQGRLVMQVAKNIAGRIELRNVGILTVPYMDSARVDLVLDLVGRDEINLLQRLPVEKKVQLEGVEVPCLDFYAFEASAPEKLKAALKLFI